MVKNQFFIYFGPKFQRKNYVFVTESVGKRFHELSLGRNDRLGLGTSKIKILANKSKKN